MFLFRTEPFTKCTTAQMIQVVHFMAKKALN